MDGIKRKGRSMRATPCIPRKFRGNRVVATPMSLLERFREVVFRLIIVSATSKASRSSRTSHRETSPVAPARAAPRHPDSYRSEAVEDCIEFFKRSAGTSDGAKSSDVLSEDSDAVEESFKVLPVM